MVFLMTNPKKTFNPGDRIVYKIWRHKRSGMEKHDENIGVVLTPGNVTSTVAFKSSTGKRVVQRVFTDKLELA